MVTYTNDDDDDDDDDGSDTGFKELSPLGGMCMLI